MAGDLDATFGIGGKVMTDNGAAEFANSVVIQPDGKIVAAGYTRTSVGFSFADDFALARYNPDGSLDATFGNGGKVITTINSTSEQANSVAIQPDGKIVVAGYTFNGNHFLLIRYNTNGSLDTSFGNGGIVKTAIGVYANAKSLAIESDGTIVVAGETFNGSSRDFALARYDKNGLLDSTFGNGGIVTKDFNGRTDQATSVKIQSDGKIVVAGKTSTAQTSIDFVLIRYDSTGSLDATFNNDGIVTTSIGNRDDELKSIAIQSDGKIVAAGYTNSIRTKYDFALIRYNTDGSLDTTFDADGIVTTAIGAADSQANSVAIQTDGKIIAAGYSYNASFVNEFALSRYNINGSLDTTFGSGGKVITPIGPSNAFVNSVAIQPDDKIVAAGIGSNGSSIDFVLTRYTSNDQPSISNIAITSAQGAQNGMLNTGDVVSVTVTYNTAVIVSGTPKLGLNIGGSAKQASYSSGSNSTTLVFTYTIASGDTDVNGISIDASSLRLDGGTIKNSAGIDASLSHNAVVDNGNYRVDTTAPTIPTATIASSNSSSTLAKTGDVITLTFTTSEIPASTPVVSFPGIPGAVTLTSSSATSYTASIVVTGAATQGLVEFSIAISDAAGNPAIRSTVSSGSSVTVANTKVELSGSNLIVSDLIGSAINDWSFSVTGDSGNEELRIVDNVGGAIGINGVISGATYNAGNNNDLRIPLSSFSNLEINSLGGSDAISVSALTLAANQSLTIDGGLGTDHVQFTTSASQLLGTGSVSLAAETVAISQPLLTDGGSVTVTADRLDIASTLRGGSVALIADSMSLTGSVNAPNQAVSLRQKSNSLPIILSGVNSISDSALDLTSMELNSITASAILIGDLNSGLITVSSPIALAGSSNLLQLTSGSDITETVSGNALGIGTLVIKGGLSPALSGQGTFDVDGSVTFDTTASYKVNLNGASNFDQLVVAGNSRTIALGDVPLVITLDTVPAVGSQQVFRIIDSTGSGSSISGKFKLGSTTLNDGDKFIVGSTTFRINYLTGGDVTLTEAGNTPPANTVPGIQSAIEDNSLPITGISLTDGEDNLSSTRLTVAHGKLTVSLVGGASISAGSNGSASLTLSGTLSEINAALASLVYLGDQDYNGPDFLEVLSSDSIGATDTDVINITVTEVNDPVTLTGTAPNAIQVAEDSSNLTAVSIGASGLNYSVGPANESSQQITYKITGIPAFISLFKSNGTTSVAVDDTLSLEELQGLKYKTIADANGSGSLAWTVADDGTTATVAAPSTLSQSISVTVLAVNDPPVITSANTVTVAENTSAVLTLASTDTEDDSIVWSIDSGLNGGLFTISSGNQLQFITPPILKRLLVPSS